MYTKCILLRKLCYSINSHQLFAIIGTVGVISLTGIIDFLYTEIQLLNISCFQVFRFAIKLCVFYTFQIF